VCGDDAHTTPVRFMDIWICRRLRPALAPLPVRPMDARVNAYLFGGKPATPLGCNRRQEYLPLAVIVTFTHNDKTGPLRAGEFAGAKRCCLPVDGYKNLGANGRYQATTHLD
jgi:hypothetical protein